jgi:hypothetical protein
MPAPSDKLVWCESLGEQIYSDEKRSIPVYVNEVEGHVCRDSRRIVDCKCALECSKRIECRRASLHSVGAIAD